MDLKEKELLLKDLSARLLYDVWINVKGQDGPKLFDFDEKLWSLWIEDSRFSINDRGEGDYEGICEIKPYLRPMSSMTEEEEKEIQKISWQFSFNRYDSLAYVGAADDGFCSVPEMEEILSYLNAHHFDYRGLIDKGLALIAPEGMY